MLNFFLGVGVSLHQDFNSSSISSPTNPPMDSQGGKGAVFFQAVDFHLKFLIV